MRKYSPTFRTACLVLQCSLNKDRTMFFVKFTLLRIKRMLRFLPAAAAGALALCFIMGIFAYSADKIFYSDKPTVVKQRIGIVYDKSDKYADLAVGMLKNIKSVEEISDFSYIDDEQTAVTMLKNNELDAVIVVPYRFVQAVFYGQDLPAKVIMPSSSGLYGTVFKELADNGMGMLTNVQAAMQSAFYAVDEQGDDFLTQHEREFDMVYMDIFLPREALFEEKSVSPFGSLSLGEYYGVMAAAVIFMLSGVLLSFAFKREDRAARELLKRRGVGALAVCFADFIMTFVYYIVIFALLFVGLTLAGIDLRLDIGGLLLAAALLSVVVSCIYNVFSTLSGSLILFAFTVISAFLGGAVLPESFLPQQLAPLVRYSPVNVLYSCLLGMLADRTTLSVLPYAAVTGVFLLFSSAVQLIREVSE